MNQTMLVAPKYNVTYSQTFQVSKPHQYKTLYE